VLAGELGGIDATGITPGRGAITFTGGPTTLYRANLELRTAMRVLLPLASGAVGDRQAVPADGGGALGGAGVSGGDFRGRGGRPPPHLAAHFAAVVVKDAVADRLRRVRGERPSRPLPADLGLHLRLEPESAS